MPKTVVTNCFHCWTKYQRSTPATWALGADEFYCNACLDELKIDIRECETIEAWLKRNGTGTSHPPTPKPSEFNSKTFRKCPCGRNLRMGAPGPLCARCRKAEVKATQVTRNEEDSMEVRKCSVEGCGKPLRATNTSGRCSAHWYQPKNANRSVLRAPAKKAPKRTPKPPSTRSAAPVAQGEPVKERVSIELTREQLIALFTSWSIERQVAAVQHVFVQELSLA